MRFSSVLSISMQVVPLLRFPILAWHFLQGIECCGKMPKGRYANENCASSREWQWMVLYSRKAERISFLH
ncbi:hypothetical protein SUGI_0393550 [Cryptomeria japonica]|nr:hypothetical protein SUGI_0393550 [Cryptomeria japonica]